MRIPFRFVLLAWPIAEIAAFIAVGRLIGLFPTVALVIASSLLGSLMLRVQGFGVLSRIAAEVRAGRSPGREMAHGVMIAVAGLLLFLPGFISDVIGILLFIPWVRDIGWRLLRNRLALVTRFSMFSGRAGFRWNGGSGTIDLGRADYGEDKPRAIRLKRLDPPSG